MSLLDSLLRRFKTGKSPQKTATVIQPGEKDAPYRTMRELPEKSLNSVPEARWPPFPRAVEAVSSRAIIDSQADLIRSLCRVTPLSEKEIDDFLLPCIVSLAEFVHLLPASQYDHHMGTGGLFGHSLEVAYYAVNGAKSRIFDVTESPEKAHLNRSRWILAAALCGLVHDIGKAVTDMVVTSESDQAVWYPRQETLAHWLRRKSLSSYYVSWKQNRENNRHQTASVEYAHEIIPQATYSFLSAAGNTRIEQEIRDAVLNSAASKGHPLCELLAMADVYSCKVDKERRKGIDPKSFYVSSPVAESVVDGLRDLIKDGTWKVNEPGGRVFVTTRGCFIVWTNLDDLINRLVAKDIKAVPREPNVLADVLIDHNVAVPPPEELTTTEGRYWSICPICSANGFLTTLRIDDAKRLYASGIPPFPIVAMVRGMELSEDEKASWIAKNGSLPVVKKPEEAAAEDAYIAGLMADAELDAGSDQTAEDDEVYRWLGLMPAEEIPDDEDEDAADALAAEVPDYLLAAPPPDLQDYAASIRAHASVKETKDAQSAAEFKNTTPSTSSDASITDSNNQYQLYNNHNNDYVIYKKDKSNDAHFGDSFLGLMPGGAKAAKKIKTAERTREERNEPKLGNADDKRQNQPGNLPAAPQKAAETAAGATDAQLTREKSDVLTSLGNLGELKDAAAVSVQYRDSKDAKNSFRNFIESAMPKRTNILATIRLDRKTRDNPDAPASEADLPDRSEPVLNAAGQKSSAGETSGKVQPVEHSASVADMAASEAEAKVAVKGHATESAADPKSRSGRDFQNSATDAQQQRHVQQKPVRLQSEADAVKAGYLPGEAYFLPEEIFPKSAVPAPWDPNSPLLPKSDGSCVPAVGTTTNAGANAENSTVASNVNSRSEQINKTVEQEVKPKIEASECATDAQHQPQFVPAFPDEGFKDEPFSAENPEFEEDIRVGRAPDVVSQELPMSVPPPSPEDLAAYAESGANAGDGEDGAWGERDGFSEDQAGLCEADAPSEEAAAAIAEYLPGESADLSESGSADPDVIAEYIPDLPLPDVEDEDNDSSEADSQDSQDSQNSRNGQDGQDCQDKQKVQPAELVQPVQPVQRVQPALSAGKRKTGSRESTKPNAEKKAAFAPLVGQQRTGDPHTSSAKATVFPSEAHRNDPAKTAEPSSPDKEKGRRPNAAFAAGDASGRESAVRNEAPSSSAGMPENEFSALLMPDSRFTGPSGKRRSAKRSGSTSARSAEASPFGPAGTPCVHPEDFLPNTSGKRKRGRTVNAGENAAKPKPVSKELRLKAMFEEMKRQMAAGEGPWITEPILPDKLGVRTSADGFIKAAEKDGIPQFLIGTVILGYQPPPILAWDPDRREFILKNRQMPRGA